MKRWVSGAMAFIITFSCAQGSFALASGDADDATASALVEHCAEDAPVADAADEVFFVAPLPEEAESVPVECELTLGDEEDVALTAEADAPALASEVSLADSVDVDREAPGVRVVFDGWRDTPSSRRRRDADEDRSSGIEEGEFTVRYRANGTVRPHRWIVCDAENPSDRIAITVNAVGRARVEAEP